MNTVRLTMAQAVIRYMMAQKVDIDGELKPMFAGVWAIFGHGNVAGLGEALYHVQDELPTYRAHNEQGMAHAAIAYAKTLNRRQMMACTASAGPGSTNMVTAAAVAHVNRLPVLFLPSDTFATRLPDPVLQQVENFHDHTLTSNDCFKPVSRFFDRITRPEQLLTSLPQAMRVLTDPVECGPVTLAMPQDVQTMAYDFPGHFFAEKVHRLRRQSPDKQELAAAIELIRQSKKPLVIAGGGVHYSGALSELDALVSTYHLPVGETQAGKGALPWDHEQNMGTIGVTGAASTNALAAEADLIIAVGTRLGDFASGSRSMINPNARLLCLNVASFDAVKHKGQPLVGDARLTLSEVQWALGEWQPEGAWIEKAAQLRAEWNKTVDIATTDRGTNLPTDAEVVGAVNRAAGEKDIVVCAAGGLPGELQKLWRTRNDRGYHMEYGYSCMGYELAGGLGTKMAKPDSEVFVMVGDGSYLMLNSEIATSVMLGYKIIAVVLDNRGYGCIHRLQQFCGGPGFNNLLDDCLTVEGGAPKTDFAAHATALGARAEKVNDIQELEAALERAKASNVSYVITLDTDPLRDTKEGGSWWDVAVAEVSERSEVEEARKRYESYKTRQFQNL
ncbi:3D-(3,5/4)-trihydroxycyclohexane-1,2-dione hydrolase [Litchfieldella anticariensis FP35 = DSM 16096]|uniref:3D-(3,5/4)-trihydroxycyclohexane-1,2-dione hydrolase n=1 Tax=Litchfieldella anticariensis (strain DSM 16096 / CECT 5854 / CIP 108499 / LMG 22089 / FP35) TaxID=1121939 RepID=S2KJ94_LITA3|nr:3D-(3,5/4)-trihydroxycyclohexane-1,2-dione acylhydrolase (decyclizing) [Halomonas anticariensis]EPC02035.1 3D-(3,5/4)-trihydroxycyclohexane-1,2-dione hydrolase [Halomonas anticariensis FP35 = DSM 16096]